MSTDALAALIQEMAADVGFNSDGCHSNAKWLRERGVVVLPADHPLRTGKESESMFDAARETFNRAIVNWHWDEAMRQAVRAALAVIKEDLK